MSAKDEAGRLLNEIKILDQKIDATHKEKGGLLEKIGEQHRLMLLEEPLLSEILWQPRTYGNKYQLYAARESEKEALGLANLLSTSPDCYGYHWAFEIEPGFNFRFDDYEITLIFSDALDIKSLINKYKLRVDLKSVNAEIQKHELALKKLDEIRKAF